MNKIKALLDEKGITPYRMAVDLDFPQSTVSEWVNGAYAPKPDKLLKISRYLGIPIEDLIEEKEVINER